jgi:hypothetical protein
VTFTGASQPILLPVKCVLIGLEVYVSRVPCISGRNEEHHVQWGVLARLTSDSQQIHHQYEPWMNPGFGGLTVSIISGKKLAAVVGLCASIFTEGTQLLMED